MIWPVSQRGGSEGGVGAEETCLFWPKKKETTADIAQLIWGQHISSPQTHKPPSNIACIVLCKTLQRICREPLLEESCNLGGKAVAWYQGCNFHWGWRGHFIISGLLFLLSHHSPDERQSVLIKMVIFAFSYQHVLREMSSVSSSRWHAAFTLMVKVVVAVWDLK